MKRDIANLPTVPEKTVESLDAAYQEAVRKLPSVYRRLRLIATGRARAHAEHTRAADELKAIQLYLELFDPRLAQSRAQATKAQNTEEAAPQSRLSLGAARFMWAALSEAGIDPRKIASAGAGRSDDLDDSRMSAPLPAIEAGEPQERDPPE